MNSFTLNKRVIKNRTATTFFVVLCIVFVTGGLLLLKNSDKKKESERNASYETIVLNTDKSQYAPGEEVYVQITSLDTDGKTDCYGNFELTINGTQIPITLSPTCGQIRASNNPDYYAYFKPENEGAYTIILKNLKNSATTETEFIVGNNLSDMTLTRWGPTKISSSSDQRYPMKLIVTAKKDFSGQIIEQVPNSLKIVWNGPAKVEKSSEYQTLTWEVNLKKDETQEFIYEYSVQGEAGKYNLGKAKISENGKVIYEEGKTWTLIAQNI